MGPFPDVERPGHLTLGGRSGGRRPRLQLPEGPTHELQDAPSRAVDLPSPAGQGLPGALLTGVGADVPLQVERVVEAFPAVGAQVPLDVVVTLHVAVQHALVGEGLLADVAGEEVSTGTVPHGHLWARMGFATAVRSVGCMGACHGPGTAELALQRPHLCAAASQISAGGAGRRLWVHGQAAAGFPNPRPPGPFALSRDLQQAPCTNGWSPPPVRKAPASGLKATVLHLCPLFASSEVGPRTTRTRPLGPPPLRAWSPAPCLYRARPVAV